MRIFAQNEGEIMIRIVCLHADKIRGSIFILHSGNQFSGMFMIHAGKNIDMISTYKAYIICMQEGLLLLYF